jgi:hypothetical protein
MTLREYNRVKSARWRERHPERAREVARKWREANQPIQDAATERWRASNSERILAVHAEWKRRNPERVKAISRRHYLNNQAKIMANVAERKAIELMAMPAWIEKQEIVKFYIEARTESLITGIPHEVDHVWPLQGKGFTGLHVPWNLRVITRIENRQKHNKRPA